MTIYGYSKDAFGKKLATVVTAASPIRSIEHLKGRADKIEEIDRALYALGRHIFVYGDRGVGKSSLAHTAAYQYQSADAEPIIVSGGPDETFKSIIANIGIQALNRTKTETIKRQNSLTMEFRGLKWVKGEEVSAIDIASQIKTVGDATELLKQVASKHSQQPAIVLDEFDTIPFPEDRAKFAALIKQLGDQSIALKFFISGIGQSCDELLGYNPSAHRQLATIELHRLAWEARREIVQEAAGAFGLNVDNDVNWRIAIISDGYPYYVHLIVEKMLWEAFGSSEEPKTLSWAHYYAGLRVAIGEMNAELRKPYEKAVLLRQPEYEDVVWSTADGDDLILSLKDMRRSYQRIIGKRESRPRLDDAKYNEIVRKLKQPAFGQVLEQVPQRPGWYVYKEKMLRGYVRMQAEANYVQLSGEREAPKQTMHIGNSRTGSYGSTVPPGVSTVRSIKNIKE